MRTVLKSCLKQFASLARTNELLIRRHRSDCLVLNYHGVLAHARPDRWSYGNCEGSELFRDQLRWLNQHFSVQGLSGLRRWHAGEWTESRPPVLLTFDDGYRNNLTVAAPILKEEGVPAIFFLSTGLVGTSNVLWNEEVRIRALQWPGAEIALPSGGNCPIPPSLQDRRTLCDRINQECKRLPEKALGDYVQYLRERTPSLDLDDDAEARAFMSWDEARALARAGFEIGSHTVSHPILSRVELARLRSELRDSKERIERELAQPCTAIAYPNGGVRDVNQAVFDEVSAAGYDWAFMTTPLWSQAGVHPYKIPRVGFPGHTDLETFQFYVSGWHNRLSNTP
jgi:peptidoglycan/xylan/chitin deacetylase (PgdA/CDA1 family)